MRSYDKQVMDLALEAGEVLLDAGAEIFRVEETMRRIAKSYGIEKSNTFVMSTGIILSAENKGEEMYAHVKHIPINSARLHKVAAVNQLSREIEEGKYTLEEAKAKLQEIRVMPGKRDVTRILAAGVGSGSFGYVLGGGVSEMIASGLSGFLLFFFWCCLKSGKKRHQKSL